MNCGVPKLFYGVTVSGRVALDLQEPTFQGQIPYDDGSRQICGCLRVRTFSLSFSMAVSCPDRIQYNNVIMHINWDICLIMYYFVHDIIAIILV